MSHTPISYMAPPGMQKYPSMSSVNTMFSLGHIPAGHGYVPRKPKPEKPYGLPYITVLNRTYQGPGAKYLKYAVASGCFSIVLFSIAAVYFGLRNVSRLIVYRTEVMAAILIVFGIIFFSLTFQLIAKAREESNKWRLFLRFKPEGLRTAAPVNYKYIPEMRDREGLVTGTLGPKALTQIPKQKYMKKVKKPKSVAVSKMNLNASEESSIEMSQFHPMETSTLPRDNIVKFLPTNNEAGEFYVQHREEQPRVPVQSQQFVRSGPTDRIQFNDMENNQFVYDHSNLQPHQQMIQYNMGPQRNVIQFSDALAEESEF